MFCERGYKFFSPLSAHKRHCKTPAVNLIRLNVITSTKTALLTPNRYGEHPCPLYMEVPLGTYRQGMVYNALLSKYS